MRREKREETKRRRRRKADCGVDNIVLLCSSRMIKNCLKLRRRKKTRKLRYRYRESIILIGMQNKCPFNFIIQGGMVAVKNLTAKQNKLDEQALKQQELLYNQVCGNRVTKM